MFRVRNTIRSGSGLNCRPGVEGEVVGEVVGDVVGTARVTGPEPIFVNIFIMSFLPSFALFRLTLTISFAFPARSYA